MSSSWGNLTKFQFLGNPMALLLALYWMAFPPECQLIWRRFYYLWTGGGQVKTDFLRHAGKPIIRILFPAIIRGQTTGTPLLL